MWGAVYPGGGPQSCRAPSQKTALPATGSGVSVFLGAVTKWLLRVLPSLPPLYLGGHVYRATPTAPRHPPEQPGCIHDVPNIREKTGWGRGRLPSSLLPLCSMSLRCLARTKWKDLVMYVHPVSSVSRCSPDPDPFGLYLAFPRKHFQRDSQASGGFSVLTIDSEALESAV